MSARIDEILAVLKIVRTQWSVGSNIGPVRIAASHQVARQRNIDVRSVTDKYARQLKPEIKGTRDFDVRVAEWLQNASSGLKGCLLAHCVDQADVAAVTRL